MRKTKRMMFATLVATTAIAMMLTSRAFAAPLVPTLDVAKACPKSTTNTTANVNALQQMLKSCGLNSASCTTPACKTTANACLQALTTGSCKVTGCTGASCPTASKTAPASTTAPKATVKPIITSNCLKTFVKPQSTATAKPQPTATAKPQPTATAKPQPTATAKPQPTATTKPQPTATVKPQPTATPVTGNMSAEESKMINLVNQERTKAGLQPLTFDATLRAPALAHSQDMSQNNYFSHTSPTYGDFSTRLKASGVKYTSAGENLAMYGSVEQAHEGLMNSPGHRANIMNTNFTRIGIGIVYNSSKGAYYITQWFAK